MKRLLAGLAILLLSACGGGGGGSSPSGGSSYVAPTAAPTTTPTTAPIQTASVQRSLVQQTLTSTDQSSQIVQYGGSSSSSTLEHLRRALSDMREQGALRQASAVTCTNGIASALTPTSVNNVDNFTISGYYDAACTELWYTGSGTITVTSSTAGTANLTFTYYTVSGSVYRYAPITLTISGIGTGSGTFTLQASLANAVGASPFVNVGLGCSIASTADSCSIAEADHLAGLNLDVAVGVNVGAALTSANAGGITIGLSGNAAANVGTFDATSVVSTGTYTFGITGGTAVDAAAVSGSLTLTPAGLIAGGSLTLSDAADGATLTASYNAGTQTIGGAVTLNATGATLATFSVTPQGTGTLTYGNGTTGTISNWVVQS